MNKSTRIFFVLLISQLLMFNGLWVAEGGEVEIDRQIKSIKQTYGVQIHYVYRSEEYFPAGWLEPPISADGEQLLLEEVERFLPIIQNFLSSYPKSILKKNLSNIYLLRRLSFYGKSYGGTNSVTSLYIKSEGKSKGYSDSFLLARMYSEFSSILMRNYNFPEKEWQKINPDGFRYTGSGVEMLGKGNLYEQNNDLLSRGFLVKYSQSSMENDFNMMSDWLFSRYNKLTELARNHKKIRMKMDLAVKFYKSINEDIDFSKKKIS